MNSNILYHIAELIDSDRLFRLAKPLVFNLFYHTVSDVYLPHIDPLYKTKNLKEFGCDLDFILHHFEAADIHKINFYRKNAEKPERHIFNLSFDDGLRGVYENVLPVLCRKGIPATIFINKAFTGNKQLFFRHKASLIIDRINKTNISAAVKNEIIKRVNNSSIPAGVLSVPYSKQALLDEIALLLDIDFQEFLKNEKPYLTVKELKEMQEKGFTIGAHSIDHPDFSELDENEQIKQVSESCSFVTETFGEKETFFSFPFSDENITDSFLKKIENTVDMSFGITGMLTRNGGRHAGRIDLEKQVKTAKAIINKSFLKYLAYNRFS
ncbi:MAG: polysaccharide deacetylase family protein [Dysgonamonadaceae bacterium]|jgi:peptidoglycan/xylan/chitin deacetylase (PgdA/CDA1 family)|nr:polysaccharide deacetylase family protein [Dysgonamonadaceae bacterium]